MVLGDVGRSPRMQYHARSLAEIAHMEVDLVGYHGATPHADILNNPSIQIHYLRPFPALPRAFFLLFAAMKLIWLSLQVLHLFLWRLPKHQVVLVQTPPAIPTLPLMVAVCWLRGTRLVVDWHNLAYTLLALGRGTGETHPLIRLSRWIEVRFGAAASRHLCVTRAMKQWLQRHAGIAGERIAVVHDRPADRFRELSASERLEFLQRFGRQYLMGGGSGGGADDAAGRELCEQWLGDRSTPLIVSSTSWTPDEDFGILLAAIAQYERVARRDATQTRSLPRLLFVITGDGPERERYRRQIAAMDLRHTRVATAWLAAEDYPRLLGAASLGVSLHASSSGIDLPMKVLDMFGSALPVCALDFACLAELVQHNVNGLVFSSPEQLCEQLCHLFGRWPADKSHLTALKRRIADETKARRWNDEWREHALGVLVP